MSVVAALVPDPVRLERVRAAIRGRHSLESCSDWAAVTLACERRPVVLAVLDLFADGELTLDPLRQLKRRFPRLTTIAYVQATLERAHDLFDVGRLGVDALIVAEVDDEPTTMAATFEVAEARSLGGRVRDVVADLRPSVRDAVLIAITRAHERLTTETLADTLAITRRVLANHLAHALLPTPQRLLTWGRLVVAAHMLEDVHRSADGVALALHFPSGSAFRNTCQRYLKATPSEVRRRGGADYVIRAMLHDDLRDEVDVAAD